MPVQKKSGNLLNAPRTSLIILSVDSMTRHCLSDHCQHYSKVVVVKSIGFIQGCRSGSGPFSVEAEAEARKFYRFRFHISYLT